MQYVRFLDFYIMHYQNIIKIYPRCQHINDVKKRVGSMLDMLCCIFPYNSLYDY